MSAKIQLSEDQMRQLVAVVMRGCDAYASSPASDCFSDIQLWFDRITGHETEASPSNTPEYHAEITRAAQYLLEVVWSRGPVGRDHNAVQWLLNAINHVVPARPAEETSGE